MSNMAKPQMRWFQKRNKSVVAAYLLLEFWLCLSQTLATSCGPGVNFKMILAYEIIAIRCVFLIYNTEHKQKGTAYFEG